MCWLAALLPCKVSGSPFASQWAAQGARKLNELDSDHKSIIWHCSQESCLHLLAHCLAHCLAHWQHGCPAARLLGSLLALLPGCLDV